MGILTNASEKIIYIIVSKNPGIDVIRLRNKTNFPLLNFIDVLNSLTEKNIITKIGTKLFINDAVSKFALISRPTSLDPGKDEIDSKEPYLSSVTAPQIRPGEFYIPDQQKFLDSRRNRR